jgi:hypothetical protein
MATAKDQTYELAGQLWNSIESFLMNPAEDDLVSQGLFETVKSTHATWEDLDQEVKDAFVNMLMESGVIAYITQNIGFLATLNRQRAAKRN